MYIDYTVYMTMCYIPYNIILSGNAITIYIAPQYYLCSVYTPYYEYSHDPILIATWYTGADYPRATGGGHYPPTCVANSLSLRQTS